MKVEIWSDIVCPFCYIGKRKFEQALEQFEDKEEIEVEWKSFELSPGLETDPTKSTYQHLSEQKGWSMEQTKQIHAQVTETAKQVGLTYNFGTSIPANSFKAHRLLHLAKENNLQNELEERLFAAHFTEGKNIDDNETLMLLGVEVGLQKTEISELLKSNLYADAVRDDISKARKIGVQGVPFFVLDNKYAVSGAQPSEVFLDALKQAWKEYDKPEPLQTINQTDGTACDTDSNCN